MEKFPNGMRKKGQSNTQNLLMDVASGPTAYFISKIYAFLKFLGKALIYLTRDEATLSRCLGR